MATFGKVIGVTTKVYANGRTILYKDDGLIQTSGPPDVCKTPSPSGPPIPVAYPNAARDSDLANGTKSVRIDGAPVCLANSNIRTSTGNEAGTAGGGLISSKIKGKLTFGSSSLDVILEGKGVVRFGDVTHHNGNTFNTVLAAAGQSGVAYGDDPIDLEDCSICGEPKGKHKLNPTDDIVEKANKLRTALKAGPLPMPGAAMPFVLTALPNVGRSGDSSNPPERMLNSVSQCT